MKEGRKFAAIMAAVIFIAIVGIFSNNVYAILVVDQENRAPPYENITADGFAQGFIPSCSILTKVDVRIRFKESGESITLEIREAINGGTLTSLTIFDSDDATSDCWHTWDITDISVTPGTRYYIILKGADGQQITAMLSLDNYTCDGCYAFILSDGYWVSEPGKDLIFVTYGLDNPPNPPSNPSPPDGATNVSLGTILSWECSDPDGDTLTYDVYFGLSSDPPLVSARQSSNTYDPDLYYYNTTYYWRIVAWDEHGASTSSPVWRFTTGNIASTPPVANFSYSINDLTVTFTDESTDEDGFIVSWHWDFGDGNTSTQQNPTHTYSKYGTYVVSLMVVDNDGATDTISKNINLSEAGNGGTGWFTWKLPFSWFAMFLMGFIGIVGVAVSAFFLKPESIKALGYAPAAGSLLITVFTIAAILMYYSGIAWYWLFVVFGLIIITLYITIKAIILRKGGKRYLRRLF